MDPGVHTANNSQEASLNNPEIAHDHIGVAQTEPPVSLGIRGGRGTPRPTHHALALAMKSTLGR